MKLTVVTATLNCIRADSGMKLRRCIESVSNIKCEHEHLIVDGASWDGTCEFARAIGERCGAMGLRISSEKDNGVYEALNKGLSCANGEWFYVLGADDWISDPDLMEALISAKYGRLVDIITAPVWTSDDLTKQTVILRRHELCAMCYPHQGVLMRTAVVRGLGGFNDVYKVSADYDLIMRALIAGARVRFTDRPFAVYCLDGMSTGSRVCTTENVLIRKTLLGIDPSENQEIVSSRVIPLRVILRFILHRSAVLRSAARFQFVRWVCRKLKMI